MPTLLHIAASPRKTRSASREVANAFITEYQASHPEDIIKSLDLWDAQLPELDEDAMNAKYAGLSGTPLDEHQKKAWGRLEELANHLHNADKIVFSLPLWNFSIPYKLKQFIDLVSQKDILFSFDPVRGLEGLLHNKKALVIYARGLDYGKDSGSGTPAPAFDFQKPYFDAWLRFIGITDIRSVIVEKTLFGDAIDLESRSLGSEQAKEFARDF
jgi:FMN-dependent NADH-azoreductase